MASWREIVRLVEQRANGRCEYCQMHQSLQGATFHIEHIIPRSMGGMSGATNLAWCCPSCNLHKSNIVKSVDPASGKSEALYDPRVQMWNKHFGWEEYQLVGRSPTGRATADTLDLNHPRRLLIRRAEEMFHLFPPA